MDSAGPGGIGLGHGDTSPIALRGLRGDGLVLGLAVHGPGGGLAFQADLALAEQRISIQYESETFHAGAQQAGRDIARTRRTEQLGWKEVRIRAADLRETTTFHGVRMPVAVTLVLQAAEERGALDAVWAR